MTEVTDGSRVWKIRGSWQLIGDEVHSVKKVPMSGLDHCWKVGLYRQTRASNKRKQDGEGMRTVRSGLFSSGLDIGWLRENFGNSDGRSKERCQVRFKSYLKHTQTGRSRNWNNSGTLARSGNSKKCLKCVSHFNKILFSTDRLRANWLGHEVRSSSFQSISVDRIPSSEKRNDRGSIPVTSLNFAGAIQLLMYVLTIIPHVHAL